MTPSERQSLREKAQKATPGPWFTRKAKIPVDGQYDYAIGHETLGVIAEVFGRSGVTSFPPAEANADYIVSVSPDVLLSLLSDLERLEQDLSASEARRARLEEALKTVEMESQPNLRAMPRDTFMDVYVPGVWRCPLCQFELMRTALFVTTGEAGVSNDMAFDTEPCPNDGTMLVPVTWKERAESNMRWGSELMERLIAATRTESLPAALEQLDRWSAALTAGGPEHG